MASRPEQRRPHLDTALQRRRVISLQRHSPGPDQTANDLSELLPWDPETDQARHRMPGSANAILRFDDGFRVSQPGEGRLAEQGQITSGRVIPNQVPITPRINGPPAVTTEVKRVLKRKQSPPKQASHRPGSKRLLKEANDLGKLQPEGCHAAPKADDLYEWAAVVEGPEHTVYEGGTFFCTIYVPRDYPFNPPKVTFHTRIYHCNINAQGEVCLDILKDKWNATMSIATVLMSLRTLMMNCNPDDALVCPIGKQFKEDRKEFDKKARQWTRRYAG